VDIPYAGSYPNPESKNIQRDPQNPLHDSTEFYVLCAIKLVHEHENFRRKPLKGNGGRIREGKERVPPGYFVQGAPEFLVTPLDKMITSVLKFDTDSTRERSTSSNLRENIVIMPPPNVVWPEAYCFCHVRSVCASRNIVNTISCGVFDTFSPNVHQRWDRDERFAIWGQKVKGQGQNPFITF